MLKSSTCLTRSNQFILPSTYEDELENPKQYFIKKSYDHYRFLDATRKFMFYQTQNILFSLVVTLPCYLIIIIIIIIELTHSKTILEITVEIEPQPVALDFKNLPQYSSRSK